VIPPPAGVEGWTVGPEGAGERLDRHVAAHLGTPRNQVQRWIADGLVRVNGAAAKPSAAVAAGDRVECAPPERKEERILPEPGDLRVLYEDAEIAVLDKPAGLTVHPGAGRSTGTLAHHLLDRYPEMAGVGGPGRPGIVHRLDQGTSGVLVAARTPAAYARLSRAFASREVRKLYLAIAYGAPSPPAGTIEAPIGRHPQERKEMAVRPGGRPARTHYRTPAARTRSASTSSTSAIRWSATRSTARRAGRGSPAPAKRPCATSPAPRSTLGGSPSGTRRRRSRWPSRRRLRRISESSGKRWRAPGRKNTDQHGRTGTDTD
jgi:RluA family pseudouridine synthase